MNWSAVLAIVLMLFLVILGVYVIGIAMALIAEIWERPPW
jgi:hypothetical protein